MSYFFVTPLEIGCNKEDIVLWNCFLSVPQVIMIICDAIRLHTDISLCPVFKHWFMVTIFFQYTIHHTMTVMLFLIRWASGIV